MPIIGFKRSGKDTFGNELHRFCKEHNISCSEIRMAKKLKSAVRYAFGFTMNQINGIGYDREARFIKPIILNADMISNIFWYYSGLRIEIKHAIGKELHTLRQLLQFVGTELIHREFGDDSHAKYACADCAWSSTVIYCCDIRYPTELDVCSECCKTHGYDIYPIYIHENDVHEKSMKEINDGKIHSSEKYILDLKEKCKRIVENNKKIGIIEYQKEIKKTLKTVLLSNEKGEKI
jgi:hypothetical protein